MSAERTYCMRCQSMFYEWCSVCYPNGLPVPDSGYWPPAERARKAAFMRATLDKDAEARGAARERARCVAVLRALVEDESTMSRCALRRAIEALEALEP